MDKIKLKAVWCDPNQEGEPITEAVWDRPICKRKGCGFYGNRALCPECPDIKQVQDRRNEKRT